MVMYRNPQCASSIFTNNTLMDTISKLEFLDGTGGAVGEGMVLRKPPQLWSAVVLVRPERVEAETKVTLHVDFEVVQKLCGVP